MRFLSLFLWSGLLVFIMALGACSSANRAAQLEESVRSYANAIRMQDDQMAIQYVAPELRGEFFEGLSSLKRYQFSDVQVSYVRPSEDLEEAMLALSIEYFSPTGMQVYQAKRFLSWSYNDQEKRWFLKENHPLGQTTAQTLDSFR